MRTLFWLLIFNYYANIYAPEIEEDFTLDLYEFTKKLAEYEDRRESRPYDALLILTEQKEVQAQGFHYYLPDEVQVKPINKLLGRRKQTFELIFLKPNHKEQIEFLCPVDIQGNTRHKSVIRKSTKHYSGFQYCLIKEEFPNKTITCKSEAIPLVVPLVSRDTKKIMKCGPNQAYEFLQFAYPYCLSMSITEAHINKLDSSDPNGNITRPLFGAAHPMLELYDICFDISDVRVAYMHHRISPSLVKYEDLLTNLNYVNTSSKISPSGRGERNEDFANTPEPPIPRQSKQTAGQTSSLQFYHEKFPKYSDMKNAFANQAMAQYPMHPQMLVPTADMPFPLWKKSTFSYINIAPLWEKLVPLMELINDRIRQFAIKRSKQLSIYSSALDVNFGGYEKLYLDRNKTLLIPTVWGKLVHDEEGGTGTLILLHNTPGNPFKSGRLCARSEEVECNFTNWWQTSSQKNIIDKTIIEETAQYAYCCQIRTTNIMSEYYGIRNMNIWADILDIDDYQ